MVLVPSMLVAVLAASAIAAELPLMGINSPKRSNSIGPLFTNCFKMATTWKNHTGGDAPIDLDELGYVKSLVPGQSVWTCVVSGGRNNPNGGQFTMTWKGAGEFDMRLGRTPRKAAAEVVSKSANRLVFRTRPGESVCLLVTKVVPSDHLRDIKVMLPGFENAKRQFYPAYLDALKPFGYIRFLDWGDNFTLDVVDWKDRRPGNYASEMMRMQAGGSYESQIALCNELDKHLWICLPHRASDDYVRNAAVLIRDTLKPNLTCIVEYSNENWNSMFPVHKWLAENKKPGENTPTAYGRRAGEVMKVFTEVFGGEKRLYRVIGGQTANPWQLQNALAAATKVCKVEAGAVTHYFSDGVVDLIWDRGESFYTDFSEANMQWAFDQLDALIKERKYKAFKANKDVCDKYGVALITYEGGPHLTNSFAKKQTHAVMPFVNRMNAHPRIKQSYALTLEAWRQAGGGAITPYNVCDTWSNCGAWGHLNYIGQPREDAPKYDFLLEYIMTHCAPAARTSR